MTLQLTALFLALLTAAALTPAARRLAITIGAVDRPADRKVHTRVMPRLGGVAVYAGFWTGVLYFAFQSGEPLPPPVIGVFMGSLVLLLLGIYDDMGDAPVRVKLPVQLAAAHIAYFLSVRFDLARPAAELAGLSLSPGIASALCYVLTILWLVGVTNAVNFLDGLDGLASGIALLASSSLWMLALGADDPCLPAALAALVGAVAGFRPYNRYPATIFLGDTGSTFLGFALASLTVLVCQRPEAAFGERLAPMLLLLVPLTDATYAILRRLSAGVSVFRADKGHLHHRILVMNVAPPVAVRWLCIAELTGCVAAIGCAGSSPGSALLLFCAVALAVLVIGWWFGFLRREAAER